MRIIIAGKFAPDGRRPMGGSQSWIATVAAELEKRGHEVTLWEPGRKARGTYDLGIIQHLRHTRPVLNFCKRTIQIVHGIIDEERPGNCDVTAYVSEGVRDHWNGDGPIVRQPIDLAFWQQSGRNRGGAIRFSYRKNALPYAKEACDAMGFEYRQVSDATPDEAREELGRSAIVFASGRAALEAMACGAPTVIYDNRSAYQEPLIGPYSPIQNMENSYSGRCGSEPTISRLLVAIEARAKTPKGWFREWVEKFHDVRKIVDQLMAL
jgi:hypothetical protein